MKEYVILLGTDPSTLASQVNGLIRRGWEPQSGVAITGIRDEESGTQIQWAQAMSTTGHAMQQVTDYTLALATDPSSLTTRVLILIREGWEPQGGVSLMAVHDEDGEQAQWAQAMVRRGPEADSENGSGVGQGREAQ